MHICVFRDPWNKSGFQLTNATVPSKFSLLWRYTCISLDKWSSSSPQVILEIILAGAASVSNNNLNSSLLSVGLPMGKVALCTIRLSTCLPQSQQEPWSALSPSICSGLQAKGGVLAAHGRLNTALYQSQAFLQDNYVHTACSYFALITYVLGG